MYRTHSRLSKKSARAGFLVYKRREKWYNIHGDEKFCNWDENTDYILGMGTEAYNKGTGHNMPLIYGDSFFAEALYKCLDGQVMFW